MDLSLSGIILSSFSEKGIFNIENDKKYVKYTIPVIIGLKNAKIYHTLLMIVPFILSIIYVLITYKSIYQYIINNSYNYAFKSVIFITLLKSGYRIYFINLITTF